MDKSIKYRLVDTAGQITAVVFDDIKSDQRSLISKELMKRNSLIEQVVFLYENQILTMGNELCINGCFAGAYLSKKPILKMSGLNKPIKFIKSINFISAKFPSNLITKINDNIVLLQGIVYIISNSKNVTNKLFLKELANKYKMPASGVIKFKSNKITPIIYVCDTDSLVWEKACGSGSLAFSIYSNKKKIIQPSKQIITVKRSLKSFTIKVPVKIVE